MDIKQQSAVVSGKFDTEATYKVWLKVYEGQLTYPSKILQPLEATVTTENKGTTPYVKLINLLNNNIYYHCHPYQEDTYDFGTRQQLHY